MVVQTAHLVFNYPLATSNYPLKRFPFRMTSLLQSILDCRREVPTEHALLVGISGIDASGKGYVAERLVSDLESHGYRVALIHVDAWLRLPHMRFLQHRAPLLDEKTPEGTHFYHHALRLDEMFENLILPLKQNREIDLTMDFVDETATGFRPFTYDFKDIDIILLEGIFIFKRAFASLFDLKVWLECSFETALTRAIERRQEGLSLDATIAAYESIYFPAQRLHFEIDDPHREADLRYENE